MRAQPMGYAERDSNQGVRSLDFHKEFKGSDPLIASKEFKGSDPLIA
jgi:hypothetical protein